MGAALPSPIIAMPTALPLNSCRRLRSSTRLERTYYWPSLSTCLFLFADLSAVRRLMSSSGAKSSPAVSSAGASDVCPSCRLPFDKGKKRRLVDTSCGHQRCYQCMFKKQECPVCFDKARGGGGGRSMQSGGESPSSSDVFHPLIAGRYMIYDILPHPPCRVLRFYRG